MSDFPKGLFFKLPHENAPDFVKGTLLINPEDAINFLREHENKKWLALDMKVSKDGKSYLTINDFKPDANKKKENSDNIPF